MARRSVAEGVPAMTWTCVMNLTRDRAAIFDPSKTYRYQLRYQLAGGDVAAPAVKPVAFVMLNPSTADHLEPDPTVRRCMRFARDWGFSELFVVNLFALRSTLPTGLLRVDDPVGPDNDLAIQNLSVDTPVICAWGTAGGTERLRRMTERRAVYVCSLLAGHKLYTIGLTQNGTPRHPLYVRADAARMAYRPKEFPR